MGTLLLDGGSRFWSASTTPRFAISITAIPHHYSVLGEMVGDCPQRLLVETLRDYEELG
jgi:hypothetical protein